MSRSGSEQGEKDLAECNILLVQDIRDWEKYPLRDRVPSGLAIVKFPCLGFASFWPFDAFNGPDDKEARRRDFPNYEFTYFDGLLGRLRREIPDPESRFAAYRSSTSITCRDLTGGDLDRAAVGCRPVITEPVGWARRC